MYNAATASVSYYNPVQFDIVCVSVNSVLSDPVHVLVRPNDPARLGERNEIQNGGSQTNRIAHR